MTVIASGTCQSGRNAGPGPPRQPALAALLVEQRLRWQQGEHFLVEGYLEQYPSLAADTESLLDLIFNEVILRGLKGELPLLEEYLQRFPGLGCELRMQFEVDGFIASDLLGNVLAPEPTPALPRADENLCTAGSAPLTFAGYQIIGLLGRGGMGVAYKAWQAKLKRPVALKMLRPGEQYDPERLARFRTEAEAVGRLQHPHMVQIFEVGEENGRPFLCLEYVDGGSLAQRLDGTPQPARQAALLLATLASAMHYAHERGIVHRDLKPANVLLQIADSKVPIETHETVPSGKSSICNLQSAIPKITDFGVAKLLATDTDHRTETGQVLGTPSYMAPEQAAGRSADIGPATDVYALGAILYELLTGRPPFKAATPLDTLHLVLIQEPVPPSRLQPTTPRDLETVCLKCLEKEPGKRYPSAKALAEDLGRFLEDRPIRAHRAGAAERTWRWCRRNPGWAAAAGLLLIVAVGASLLALGLSAALGRTRQAEHQATERLFGSRLAEARAIRFSGQMGQRWAALQALQEASDLARTLNVDEQQILPLRNEALACLALVDIKMDKEWNGSPPGCNGVAFSASYDVYAQSWADGIVRLRRVADDGEIASLRCREPPGLNRRVTLRFSPADRYLAVRFFDAEGKRPVYVWDLKRTDNEPVLCVPDVHSLFSFAPDEGRLAVGLPGNAIGIYDLASAREIAKLATDVDPYALAFDPEGRRLAVACEQPPEVQIRDVADGRLLRRIVHPQGVQGLAWTPDGRTLASGCMDHRIYFWDVDTGARQADLQGHSWDVFELSFSHAGDLLMSASHDHTLRLWDTRLKKSLITIPNARFAGFSRDHQFAGATVHGNSVGLCRMHHSPEFRMYGGHKDGPKGSLYTVDFHPDGRLLASSGADDIHLWDLAAGRELAVLPGSAGYGALFHPPTQSLLTFGRGTLSRWPLRTSARAGGTQLSVGPPQELLLVNPQRVGHGRLCWRGPGWKSLVLTEDQRKIHVVELEDPVRRISQWDFPGAGFIAASPDGRWIACGTWSGTGVRVWDAQRGELAKEWACGDADVAFSPDGQWLITTPGQFTARGAECCCWRVGTWEPGNRLSLDRSNAPAAVAYSPNGNLVAVAHTMTEIVLLAPNDFREVGRLQAREPLLIHCMKFSPDGSRLVVGMGQGIVGVWDLRLLWQELADMHLDSGLPPVCDAPR